MLDNEVFFGMIFNDFLKMKILMLTKKKVANGINVFFMEKMGPCCHILVIDYSMLPRCNKILIFF